MIFVEIFASILTNCMVTLFGVGFWQKVGLIFVEIVALILTNCVITGVGFWQKVGFNFDIVEEMYFRVTSLSDQARYFRGNVLFSI